MTSTNIAYESNSAHKKTPDKAELWNIFWGCFGEKDHVIWRFDYKLAGHKQNFDFVRWSWARGNISFMKKQYCHVFCWMKTDYFLMSCCLSNGVVLLWMLCFIFLVFMHPQTDTQTDTWTDWNHLQEHISIKFYMKFKQFHSSGNHGTVAPVITTPNGVWRT